MIDEQQFKDLFDKNIDEYATQNQYGVSKIPFHVHNGTDSPLISAANASGGNQYSLNYNFTHADVGYYTITCGFTPTKAFSYTTMNYTGANNQYGTSNGFAGATDPVAGKDNWFNLNLDLLTFASGVSNYFIGNTNNGLLVNSWNTNGITLQVICPSGWNMNSNIILLS